MIAPCLEEGSPGAVSSTEMTVIRKMTGITRQAGKFLPHPPSAPQSVPHICPWEPRLSDRSTLARARIPLTYHAFRPAGPGCALAATDRQTQIEAELKVT